MRSVRVLLLTLVVLSVPACGRSPDDGDSSKRPPVSGGEPAVDARASLRPEFVYGEGKRQRTGTAFVVRAGGRKYLVTAAHLYKDAEWRAMETVSLRTMAGEPAGQAPGTPLYVGKWTEASPLDDENDLEKLGEDLAVAALPEGNTGSPLHLAARPARVGDLVWVVGCEKDTPGSQRLYGCRVRFVADGYFTFEPLRRFDPWDFSGAPVIDDKGNVVGNLLMGSRTKIHGTTVLAMRERFKRLGIPVD